MGLIDDLTVEVDFYAAMHELAVVAWRKDLTVEALLTLTELLDWPDRPEATEAGKAPST